MSRADLRLFVLQLAGRIVRMTKLAGNSTTEGFMSTDAPPIDTTDGEEAIAGSVRKLQHYGFRSRPPVGSDILVVATRGSMFQQVCCASDNPKHGPTDLEDGEACLFSKVTGTVVKVTKDGDVVATSSASGTQLKLHGSTSATPGAIEATGPGGALVRIDKDGNVTAVPAAGKFVQLGDSVNANLDFVVLYQGLKTQFDALVTKFNAHFHVETGVNTNPIIVAQQASALSSAVVSSNVVGKKP